MIATDIKEYRKPWPRLYGAAWPHGGWSSFVADNVALLEAAIPNCDNIRFQIPSEREQKLLEERERAILSVLRTFPDDPDVQQVVAIDRQLAELRGAK